MKVKQYRTWVNKLAWNFVRGNVQLTDAQKGNDKLVEDVAVSCQSVMYEVMKEQLSDTQECHHVPRGRVAAIVGQLT